MPHVPQGAGLQFQTDQEQHHHHTEFSKMLQVGCVRHKAKPRSDGDPCQQVSKHRSQPQTRGNRYGDHCGKQEDRCEEKKLTHSDFAFQAAASMPFFALNWQLKVEETAGFCGIFRYCAQIVGARPKAYPSGISRTTFRPFLE